jgi:flavin reductase (DIM6/NTAB) family NADH-FMN oxidoreductase RutF
MALIEELKEITTGIYVLTVRSGDVRHGMSSSWVAQVSGEPPLIVASVDRAHRSNGLIRAARRFGLNVVGRQSRSLEDFFYSPAARGENNLGGFAIIESPSGVPLLAEAMVGFDCAVEAEHEAGDHTLFVARVDWAWRGRHDTPLSSLELEYVYLGTGRIVKR